MTYGLIPFYPFIYFFHYSDGSVKLRNSQNWLKSGWRDTSGGRRCGTQRTLTSGHRKCVAVIIHAREQFSCRLTGDSLSHGRVCRSSLCRRWISGCPQLDSCPSDSEWLTDNSPRGHIGAHTAESELVGGGIAAHLVQHDYMIGDIYGKRSSERARNFAR